MARYNLHRVSGSSRLRKQWHKKKASLQNSCRFE